MTLALLPTGLTLTAGSTTASATHPAIATSSSARPPGLVQPANSKTSCIYAPLGAPLDQAEHYTGIDYHCLETFVTGSNTWSQWVSPWVTSSAFGYTSWVAAAPTTHTLVITMNLVPNAVAATPNWRAQGAAGDFDVYATQLAQHLVAAGLGYSVIRLGPEMNGPWETDWIGTKPAQWHEWAVYFARIVRTMRAVAGAHFLFDWNVNAGYENLPLAGYYPGNSVVDIIGIDAYDEASIVLPPVGSPKRWTTLSSEDLGLDQVDKFAVAHHKPLSIPEWGTLSTHGDDGAYVTGIGRFVMAHDVAYESWYDVGDNHILQLDPTSAPKSLAAYRTYFGPTSRIEREQLADDRAG